MNQIAVLAGSIICIVCNLSAQAQSETAPPAEAAPQTTLVKIATIEGRAANDEFTHNVQVIQAQRQEFVRLNELLTATPAGADHDSIQARIDAAVKRLDTDNQMMAKTYGYSLLRNYVRVPERSEVFVVLTDEEFAKQPAPTDGSHPAKAIKVCSLNDAKANQAFQETVQRLQQMRQQAAALKGQLDAAEGDKGKAYAQGQFDLQMQQLNDANTAATRAYAFNLNRQYVLSIETSTLYMAATAEEAATAAEADRAAEESGRSGSTKPKP